MSLQTAFRREEDIWVCAQCGFCTSHCPVAEQKGWESFGPRGKMYLLKALLKKDIGLSKELIDRFYSCTTCSRCSKTCQTEIDLVEIWEAARALLVKEKVGPTEVHKLLAQAIAECRNPFGEPVAKRGEWAADLQCSAHGDIAFFAGCTAAIKIKALARNSVRILQSLGQEVAVLGEDEWCCGSVLLRTGQRELIKEIVAHNVEALKNTGASVVVSACTGCFKTIGVDYPELYGQELPFKIMHLTQYLAEQIKQGKLKFMTTVDAKVTYHDPCHLGLHLGEYDAPRTILNAIPGLKLMEMENIRESSKCCGAGGGVKAAYPELAQALARARAAEAEATGATILASCCPFCKVNLSEAIGAAKLPIVQKDITELVLEAMGKVV